MHLNYLQKKGSGLTTRTFLYVLISFFVRPFLKLETQKPLTKRTLFKIVR